MIKITQAAEIIKEYECYNLCTFIQYAVAIFFFVLKLHCNECNVYFTKCNGLFNKMNTVIMG